MKPNNVNSTYLQSLGKGQHGVSDNCEVKNTLEAHSGMALWVSAVCAERPQLGIMTVWHSYPLDCEVKMSANEVAH